MKLRQSIDKVIGNFLVLLMIIMTLDVLWGVFTRYIMGSQASWSEELARFLLIWIGILGAGFAAGQRVHLAIDLLSPQLSPGGQRSLSTFINLLIIAFALFVMVIGGGRLIYISQILGQLSPALQLPMAVVYAVIPISGILVVYYKLNDLAMANK